MIRGEGFQKGGCEIRQGMLCVVSMCLFVCIYMFVCMWVCTHKGDV